MLKTFLCLICIAVSSLSACAPVDSVRDASVYGVGGAANAAALITHASVLPVGVNAIGAVGSVFGILGYVAKSVKHTSPASVSVSADAHRSSVSASYTAPVPSRLHLNVDDHLVSAGK
jgi:hypothetical protein